MLSAVVIAIMTLGAVVLWAATEGLWLLVQTMSGHLLSSEDRTANTMQTSVIQTAFAGAGIGQLVAEPNAAILVREMVAIG